MRGATIKTKTLKREKTCFCVKQLVQRHYGGSGRTKAPQRQGFSPTQTHKEHLTLVKPRKNPRDRLYTGLLRQRCVIRPYAIVSSISQVLCSVHHPILLFLSLFCTPLSVPPCLHGLRQDTVLPASEVCVHKGLFRRTDPGAS